jgi:thiamine biosynthesis lipoprotein
MRRVLLPLEISNAAPLANGVLRDFGGRTMGTSWSVRLVADPARDSDFQSGLQRQLDAVVAQMSHWEASSDLGRFNRAPAGSWHVLPQAFFDVLSFALDVARESRGAYDPCAGVLVNLWGFGPEGRFGAEDFTPPAPDAVAQLLRERAAQQLLLEANERRALQPGGVQLDFSAVAKGYAVDRLAFFLKSNGVQHFLVEVGGELRGAGMKPDGQPWWVRLEEVDDASSAAASPDELVLALHGLSVATSGDYRRYFDRDGQRYPHTIDPRSGKPIDNGLASVTVLHPMCMAADAWSTALTVLGLRDGMALAERLGLAVRFVERTQAGLREHMSTSFQQMLAE